MLLFFLLASDILVNYRLKWIVPQRRAVPAAAPQAAE
jgi:hypothetical protein